MINKKVLKVLNEQIKNEFESAYIYLSMSAYLDSIGYEGMAQWMKVQSKEEIGHGMKIFEYINERDGKVELLPIPEPQKEWKSPLEIFEDAYKHELFVTSKINELVALAKKEDDNATGIFLQWFVTEQVEEESSALKVVDVLKKVGDSGSGLIMLDHQLGKRQ